MRPDSPEFPFGYQSGAVSDRVGGYRGFTGDRVGRESREQVDEVEGVLHILQSECEGGISNVSACILRSYSK